MRKVTDQDLTNFASYEVLDYLEGIGFQHLLERFEGNQSQIAEAIGMTRTTLRRKLVKHCLHEVKPYVRKASPRANLSPDNFIWSTRHDHQRQ